MVSGIQSIVKGLRFRKNKASTDKWYVEEPYIDISEKRRKELKELGFLASADVVYDFKKYGHKMYVNRRDYHLLHPFSETNRLIDNKAFVPCLFSWSRNVLPEVSIYINEGSIVYGLGCNEKNDLRTTLQSLFYDHHELFAKKVNRSGGIETIVIKREIIPEVLPQLGFQKWLINNRLYSENYSKEIFGNSANTLRVVFFKNTWGEMKVFRILHRFGTSESKNVDNCSQGGMVCNVNKETGELSKGVIYGSSYRNGWYSNHVDSKKPLEGIFIPGWKEKIKAINEIVQNLFYISYGGIDIVPTNDGLKVLEINSLPNMLLNQMLEPALLNTEFSEFLKKKGYHPPT